MKILVVDRAEEIRGVLDILERVPTNEILSAASGEEALAAAEGQQIDLLITEVILEPMNGFTLRNKIENRHPGVRTIFVTGYDLSPYAEHTAGYEIVLKPPTPQTLFQAITRAMGLGAPPPAAPVQVAPAAAPPQPPPAPAVPRATPAPAAKPTAVPRAATPPPSAKPAAVPKATPAPSATPLAAPKAAPKATPKATPAAVPARATPAPSDPLLGKTLGSYRVERRLGNGKWGPVYMAIQTSMNRPVAMELLAAEFAADEAARQNFVATARAKAAVQHTHILAVYEADQAGDHFFYTHEYVDGLTLAQMLERGQALPEPMALRVIKFVSQGLAHLHQQRIGHSIPDANDIYIGSDGLPRLSNVALPLEEMPMPQDEIHALGALVSSVLPGGRAQDRGMQAMLARMTATTSLAFQSWPALFQAIQAIEPKVIPADAFKLSAQDEAAIRAVDAARRRQKRQVLISAGGLLAFLVVLGLVVWWEFMRPATHEFLGDEMVDIPAGPFIYQNGQTITLPEFYIDKYEVTIGEYAKFLAYLASDPKPEEFDSPVQPRGLGHTPPDWEIYYGRASSSFAGYRNAHGVPITLDCPVFNVNYFDAYAYAKWKGRRLPTEQEWEKAARGPSGNLYPWGNEWDPKKANNGGDFWNPNHANDTGLQSDPPPDYKPSADGYAFWAPVNALMSDRSPYGVIGMAGNVSEWTGSWDASKTYPVIRGGNFKSTPERAMTTAAIRNAYPEYAKETLGFRTASSTPPAK